MHVCDHKMTTQIQTMLFLPNASKKDKHMNLPQTNTCIRNTSRTAAMMAAETTTQTQKMMIQTHPRTPTETIKTFLQPHTLDPHSLATTRKVTW